MNLEVFKEIIVVDEPLVVLLVLWIHKPLPSVSIENKVVVL